MEFWKAGEGGSIYCLVCGHRCLLAPGQKGRCGVRENTGTKIECLTAGRLTAIHGDPMEKKPLYHFLPGSQVLSAGSWGCNMSCPWCQNWQISQNTPGDAGQEVTEPWELIEITERKKIPALAFTYNEPTIALEYVLETFTLARKRGLKTVLVTNGFFSPQAGEALAEVTDGANIDLKHFHGARYREYTGGKLELIRHNIEELASRKVWVELTSLIVPGVNDTLKEWKDAASWIASLGPLPWHINGFHPSFRMDHIPPAGSRILEDLRSQAMEQGVLYVYTGNTPDGCSDTRCPGCGEVLIRRKGYRVSCTEGFKGACPRCGRETEGVWQTPSA